MQQQPIRFSLLALLICSHVPRYAYGFQVLYGTRTQAVTAMARQQQQQHSSSCLHLSDWSSFRAIDDDDDDDLVERKIDTTAYAAEEDSQDVKAAVGSTLSPPAIENDAEPLFVPPGSQLELSEDTVLSILAACREELGTLFGYSAENRGVGITGGVDFVDMDGPSVVIRLKGRFWHQRTTVLDRVANYLQQRIPEIIDVQIEDPWQLTDEANEEW